MNLENNEINDSTPIFGKYNTIGQVKKASIKSSIQFISRMPASPERNYLCKWLFEKHYLKKKFIGNLTTRIKNISNNSCYRQIISHCFDGIDPLINYETKSILNEECKSIIKSLHDIDPSSTGTFMDYLMRRIINELRQEKFRDNRAGIIITADGIDGVNMKNDTSQLWEFMGEKYTMLKENPYIKSKPLTMIQNGDKFIELDRTNEWLKIKYKKFIGWVQVQYLNVPFPESPSRNKCFKEIENNNDDHYCESGCKMKMKQLHSRSDKELKECVFPYCQNMCYIKAQNTNKYKTKDILKELYIVSCCHIESFGQCIPQDRFNKMMNILDNLDDRLNDFVNPLIDLCKLLVTDSENVLLNPVLGSLEYDISADCDIVIGDTLIDIKCTSQNNNISEQLQLLGYTSLLKYNPRYSMRMYNICIINLLEGQCKLFNIKNISDKNLLEYLHLLTNKYNPNKKIITTPNFWNTESEGSLGLEFQPEFFKKINHSYRPSKEKLLEDIREFKSITLISKKYKAGDRNIENWIKAEGLYEIYLEIIKNIRKPNKKYECSKYKTKCPSKEDLLKDLQEFKTIIAIAKKYETSGNSVKRWIKKYEITNFKNILLNLEKN